MLCLKQEVSARIVGRGHHDFKCRMLWNARRSFRKQCIAVIDQIRHGEDEWGDIVVFKIGFESKRLPHIHGMRNLFVELVARQHTAYLLYGQHLGCEREQQEYTDEILLHPPKNSGWS